MGKVFTTGNQALHLASSLHIHSTSRKGKPQVGGWALPRGSISEEDLEIANPSGRDESMRGGVPISGEIQF